MSVVRPRRRESSRPALILTLLDALAMPIYEYQCDQCSHHLEVLQKIADEPLVYCPECGEASLHKQVSAAAFRLKGTGWYETDFKHSGKDKDKDKDKADTKSKADGKDGSKDAVSTDKSTPAKSESGSDKQSGGANKGGASTGSSTSDSA